MVFIIKDACHEGVKIVRIIPKAEPMLFSLILNLKIEFYVLNGWSVNC